MPNSGTPSGPTGVTGQGRKFLDMPASPSKSAPLPKSAAKNYPQTFNIKKDKPHFVIEQDNDSGNRERLIQKEVGGAIVTEEFSAATGERAVCLPGNGEIDLSEAQELIHANASIPDERERPDINRHFRNDIERYANEESTSRRKTFTVPALPWH